MTYAILIYRCANTLVFRIHFRAAELRLDYEWIGETLQQAAAYHLASYSPPSLKSLAY
jgi:hypothetical protein